MSGSLEVRRGNTGTRPGGADRTYGTNMTYMSYWSYKSHPCDVLGARHQHDVGTP